MNILGRFHRLHPSAPPTCRSGQLEVVDVLFLITVSVYPCQRFIAVLVGIQIQALPFVCAAFQNHLHPVPQEGGTVARLAVPVQLVFFDAPAKYIVDVAVAFSMVQLFDTHFGQAVFGIVMVILGTAGGLFAADMPMRYQFSLKVVINSLPPDFKAKIYHFSIVFLMLPTFTFLLL